MCILIFPSKVWGKKCTLYMAKYKIEGQIQSLPDKIKTKGARHYQTIIKPNVKGTYLRKRRSKL